MLWPSPACMITEPPISLLLEPALISILDPEDVDEPPFNLISPEAA